MASQILLLISVCVAVVGTFMVAEDKTVNSLLQLLQQGKGKLINDRILQESQPAVDTVHLYGEQNLQNTSDLICNSSATYETKQRVMNGFFRIMNSIGSYPFVYIAYQVGNEMWADCGCSEAECDMYNETTGAYTQFANKGYKFEASVVGTHSENTTGLEYVKAIREQRSFALNWTIPYVYNSTPLVDTATNRTIPGKLFYITTVMQVLEFDANGKPIRAFAIDVDLRFIMELLKSQRSRLESDEYLMVIDPATEKVIGASFPGNKSLLIREDDYTNEKLDRFYRVGRTGDDIADRLANAMKNEGGGRYVHLASKFTTNIGKKKYFCSVMNVTIPEGPAWLFLYGIAEDEIMTAVKKARSTSYLVSAAVISLSCAIGFVIMRSVLSPLKVMSTIVLGAAQMDVESISRIPKSNVTEVASLQEDVNFLVTQLKEFRLYLPENVLQHVANAHDDDEADSLPSKATTISLSFVERDGITLKNQAKCVFAFEYKEGKSMTYQRLVSVCRQRAGIAVGQSVIFQYNKRETQQWEHLLSDADFFTAVSMHHDILECRIGKYGHMDFKCLVRGTVGICATCSAVFIAWRMWNDQTQESYLLTAALIITISIGILTNLWYTHKFLKKCAVGNPDLGDWLRERVDEASFGMFLGAFSVMNLEVIACKLTIFKEISLHAPFSTQDYRAMEKGSLPGFFLGPIFTIILTSVYMGLRDPSAEDNIDRMAEYVVFILNGLFVLMMIQRLVSFPKVAAFLNPQMLLGKAGHHIATLLSEKEIKEKTAECTSMVLKEKYVTLLHCLLKEYDDQMLNNADPTDIEEICNGFYEVAFRLARRHNGVVTHFHGGDVIIVFNGTSDVLNHEVSGVKCALDIMEKKGVACAVVAETMKVGNLGTATRRAFQHISPANLLAQSLAEFAKMEGCPILVTANVAKAWEDHNNATASPTSGSNPSQSFSFSTINAVSHGATLRRFYAEVSFLTEKVSLYQVRPPDKPTFEGSAPSSVPKQGIVLGSLVNIKTDQSFSTGTAATATGIKAPVSRRLTLRRSLVRPTAKQPVVIPVVEEQAPTKPAE